MDLTDLLTPPFVRGISAQSMADYIAHQGINPSWLSHMARSPKHFLNARDRDDTYTSRTLIGVATHALVLEPDTFDDRFTCYEGVRNEKHHAYAEFLAENAGKLVLSVSELAAVRAVAEAVLADSIARPLIDMTDHERSVFGVVYGVKCKGRVDGFGGKYLIDLKTTTDVQMEPFGRVFARLNYAMKLAAYRELLRENEQCIQHVVLITCETDPPYDVACVEVPESVLDHGMEKCLRLLHRLRECIECDKWPGVANDRWYPLHVPNWSMPEDEMLEVFEG